VFFCLGAKAIVEGDTKKNGILEKFISMGLSLQEFSTVITMSLLSFMGQSPKSN